MALGAGFVCAGPGSRAVGGVPMGGLGLILAGREGTLLILNFQTEGGL